MKSNILIVVAHPDDEVIGMGGTIKKHVAQGDKVSLLIMGDGESSRKGGLSAAMKKKIAKRRAECGRSASLLGISEVLYEEFPDNCFDSVPLLNIIKKVEEAIDIIKPEIIYTHHAHDLNIDHQLTFQAVLTACRPLPGAAVKKILSFEVLSSTGWQAKRPDYFFAPNLFIDIGPFIEKKIEAFKIYKDEIKKYPHPRSTEGVKILAQYRGMEAGYEYAEAFQIIRSLE